MPSMREWNHRNLFRMMKAGLCCLVACGSAGCGVDGPAETLALLEAASPGFSLAAPPAELIGKPEAGRVFVAVTADPLDAADLATHEQLSRYDVVSVDVQSLEQTTLVADLAVVPGQVVAGGRYVAWVNVEDRTAHVFDIESEAETVIVDAEDSACTPESIGFIADTRVGVFCRLSEADSRLAYLVVDLADGSRTSIEEGGCTTRWSSMVTTLCSCTIATLT